MLRGAAAVRLTGLAAEMAFFATLGLFPGLLVVAGLLGWLDTLAGGMVAGRAESAVVEFLGRLLTDRASGVVTAMRDLFERGRGGVVVSGLALALWSMSRGFAAAIRALDMAYRVAERRGWLKVRLTGILLALGSALMVALVLVILVLGPLMDQGSARAERIETGTILGVAWSWLRPPILLLLLVAWMTALYRFAPNHRTGWRRGLPGAVTAALLWVLLALGFRAYIGLAAGMNQVFGVLGGGLIVLIFLYLLSLALLLGGELNAVLIRSRRH